jgi:hypothetical protein
MVQKLVIVYIFVFSNRYSVAYHSNVSFPSQNTYLMADGCFVLFCSLLSTIVSLNQENHFLLCNYSIVLVIFAIMFWNIVFWFLVAISCVELFRAYSSV